MHFCWSFIYLVSSYSTLCCVMACETDVRLFKSIKVQSFKLSSPVPRPPLCRIMLLNPGPGLQQCQVHVCVQEQGPGLSAQLHPSQHRPLCEVRLAPFRTSLTPGGLTRTLTGLTRLAPPPPPWSNIQYAALFLFVSPGLRHCAQSTWLLSQTLLYILSSIS